MNSGIPLENFPLVPQGHHHHHHQDHLAFARIEIDFGYLLVFILRGREYFRNVRDYFIIRARYV
jgi:hypothetical protein